MLLTDAAFRYKLDIGEGRAELTDSVRKGALRFRSLLSTVCERVSEEQNAATHGDCGDHRNYHRRILGQPIQEGRHDLDRIPGRPAPASLVRVLSCANRERRVCACAAGSPMRALGRSRCSKKAAAADQGIPAWRGFSGASKRPSLLGFTELACRSGGHEMSDERVTSAPSGADREEAAPGRGAAVKCAKCGLGSPRGHGELPPVCGFPPANPAGVVLGHRGSSSAL